MANKKFVAYATGNDDSNTFFETIEDAVGEDSPAIAWFNKAQPGDSLVMEKGAFFGTLILIKLSGEHKKTRR